MQSGRDADDRRVTETARRFRAKLAAGGRPRIEEQLDEVDATLRPALLRELVAAEASLRRDSGEEPPAEEYVARFPELSAQEAVLLVTGESGSDPSALTVVPSASSSTIHPDRGPLSGSGTERPGVGDSTIRPQSDLGSIGRYRLVRCLGRGTFGEVFEALDPELDRRVALKLPRAGRVLTQDEVGRFRAEGRVLARLRHPGLVAVYDAGLTPDGRPYVVSELVDGEDLSERLDREKKLSLAEATRIVAEAAEALAAAHAAGVVHRDVKPANLMVNRDGDVRVADFGIALPEDQQEAARGEVLGSPAYMSPEQFAGEAHLLDGRTDVWALGVVLYELLTGRRPFSSQTYDGLKEEVLRRDPRPLRQLNPKLPAWIEEVLAKCVAKSPADRYPTAADLAADLRRGPVQAVRRRFALPLAVGTLVLFVAAGAALWFVLPRLDRSTGEVGTETREEQRSEVGQASNDGSGEAEAVTPIHRGDPVEAAKPVSWLPAHAYQAPDAVPKPLSFIGRRSGWDRIIRRVPAADGSSIEVPFRLVPQNRSSDPPAFYMMETKVWNDLFHAYRTSDTDAEADTRWSPTLYASDQPGRLPALNVRLREAVRCAKWLGGRLPVPNQWDKAAGYFDRKPERYGPYLVPEGNSYPDVAVSRSLEAGPVPVGSARDDVSPFGVRDMAGNGWEFTRGNFFGGTPIPDDPSEWSGLGFFQVSIRGRSFTESEPLLYDQWEGFTYQPDAAKPITGFRVVLEQN